jgi:hypothetical protein
MRKSLRPAAAFSAAVIACVALSGCPVQPSYPSTITPVYATTSAGALWVSNGSTWTSYTAGGSPRSVVVAGSGSGASVFVAGTVAGVSRFNGTAWTPIGTGLGSTTVNRLFIGPNLYAATAGGLSILNDSGSSWTNDAAVGSANDVSTFGTNTFVASTTGFYIYNGTSQVAGSPVAPATIVSGSGSVTAVFVDSVGDLVVGTNRGLAVQFAGSSSWIGLLPGTPSVNQVTLDGSGYLYASTSAGLYKIGSSALLVLPTPTSCVCVDGAGTIYAGTGAGLQVSSDGGSSWTTELTGQAVTSVTTTAPLYSF